MLYMGDNQLPFDLSHDEEFIDDAYTDYRGPVYKSSEIGTEDEILRSLIGFRITDAKIVKEEEIKSECNTYLTNKRILFFKPNWWKYDDKGFFCQYPLESIVGVDYSIENRLVKIYVKTLIGDVGEITIEFTFDSPDDYRELLKWIWIISSGSVERRAELFKNSDHSATIEQYHDPLQDFTKQYDHLPFIIRSDEKLYRENFCYYYGERVTFETKGRGIGVIGSAGLGVGFSRSKAKQKREEDGFFDSKTCWAYLTNQRVLLNFVDENKFIQHPLSAIVGVSAEEGGLIHSRKIKFSLTNEAGESLFFRLKFLYPFLVDDWMLSIKQIVADQTILRTTRVQGNSAVAIQSEDPLHILRLRYAKGEITREEFLEMKHVIEG